MQLEKDVDLEAFLKAEDIKPKQKRHFFDNSMKVNGLGSMLEIQDTSLVVPKHESDDFGFINNQNNDYQPGFLDIFHNNDQNINPRVLPSAFLDNVDEILDSKSPKSSGFLSDNNGIDGCATG